MAGSQWLHRHGWLGSLETAPKRTSPLSPTMSNFTKRILQAFVGCGRCAPRMDPLVLSWGLLASAHQRLAQRQQQAVLSRLASEKQCTQEKNN